MSAVADGRSFLLEDGREIRLPGIEVPPPPRLGETGARAEAGNAARAALTALLAGQTVELRQSAPAADRYGRGLAHAYFTHEGAQKSAAHEMLDQGFARVSAHVGNVACASELLSREAAARHAKLGLWGEAYYAIVGAENLAGTGPFHSRGRQGFIGPRERRHDIHEFRTPVVAGPHGYDLETQ